MVAYPKVAAAFTGQTAIARRYILGTIAVCGAIAIALEALSSFVIPFFFGEEFHAAIGIARILLLASLLMSIKRVLNDCARGLGMPDLGLKAEAISWLPLAPGFLLFGNTAEGIAWTLVATSATCVIVLALQMARSRSRMEVYAVIHAANAA
jgi:O-antigen/teichoic acid export membrane protein